jgi:hypothetical protein
MACSWRQLAAMVALKRALPRTCGARGAATSVAPPLMHTLAVPACLSQSCAFSRSRGDADCFHHTRTFLAFMPEQTLHLVVTSALEIRRAPDPELELHVCTRGVYEGLLRTIAEAKSGMRIHEAPAMLC